MNQPDPQRRIAGGVEYELTRRRVRNLNIRVRTDGSVAVSAPRRVPLSSVDAFVAAHAGWVAAAQGRMAVHMANRAPNRRCRAKPSPCTRCRHYVRSITRCLPPPARAEKCPA